ncbi:MAG: hypothetical protein KY475_26685 [Planctomycetes bacterium]|nr:hypothetical protein [Planctomycetota bacterium]
MNQPESNSNEPREKVARQGVGLGMDMSFSPPPDPTGWRQCPDCEVWYKDQDREACPNCGYVFGQKAKSAPAPALDEATLRAAHNLIDTAGSAQSARIALDSDCRPRMTSSRWAGSAQSARIALDRAAQERSARSEDSPS